MVTSAGAAASFWDAMLSVLYCIDRSVLSSATKNVWEGYFIEIGFFHVWT